MTVASELVTLLGIDIAPDAEGKERKYTAGMMNIRKASLAAGAALLSLAGLVAAATNKFAKGADASKKFSDSYGVDNKVFQSYTNLADHVGGTAADIQGDFANLHASFGSVEQGLAHIQGTYAGLSNNNIQLFGTADGLSQTMIRILQAKGGLADLKKQFEESGAAVSDELANNAAELAEQQVFLSNNIKGLFNQFNEKSVPIFTDLIAQLNDFLVTHKKVIAAIAGTTIAGIIDGFKTFGEIIKKVGGFIWDLIKPIANVIGEFEGIIEISDVVTGALIIMSAALAPIVIAAGLFLAKWIAIGAAIGLAVKGAKELFKWWQDSDIKKTIDENWSSGDEKEAQEKGKNNLGNHSLELDFGGDENNNNPSFLEHMSQLSDWLSGYKDDWKLFFDSIKNGFKSFGNELAATFKHIAADINEDIKAVGDFFGDVINGLKASIEKLSEWLSNYADDWGLFFDKITAIFTSIGEFLNDLIPDWIKNLSADGAENTNKPDQIKPYGVDENAGNLFNFIPDLIKNLSAGDEEDTHKPYRFTSDDDKKESSIFDDFFSLFKKIDAIPLQDFTEKIMAKESGIYSHVPASTINNVSSQQGAQNNTININGAGNPHAVARAVEGRLARVSQTIRPGPGVT